MESKNLGFDREPCPNCGQNTVYLIALDRGTAIIVKALSTAIGKKGINIIHPTKEMEIPGKSWTIDRAIYNGELTSTQIGNFTRARVHGLIARVDDHPGNWCLTTKGSQFLKGESVPKFAIIKKTKHDDRSHKFDYFEKETLRTTFRELVKQEEFWTPIDFEIREGRIVKDIPKVAEQGSFL